MFNNIIKVLNKDWLSFVIEKYKGISELNKKTFWIVFLSLNFVFLFHTINFLWGNHDWLAIKEGVNWNSFFFNGRYSATAIKMILTHGQVLPIINNLLGFCGLSLAAVTLLNYWKCKKELKYWVFAGLLLTCTPFTNIWLWYAYHTIENFTAPLFVILGLILSLLSNNKPTIKSILINLTAIFLMTTALGVYPSVVVNIFTVFTGRIFIELLEIQFNKQEIKSKLFMFKNSIINIIFSCIFYKLILFYMNKKGLLADVINIQSASLSEIISNIIPAFKAAFIQLFHYRFICMPQRLTTYFAVLTVLFFIIVFYNIFTYQASKKTKVLRGILILIGLFTVLMSTKLAALLALKNVLYSIRIDFYGLMFLRVLIVIVLFNYINLNFIKNIIYVFCVIILHLSLICNSICIKSFKLGTNAELMQSERIINMIANNPDYIQGKKYDCITIGYPEPLRQIYIPAKFKPKHGFEVGLGSHTITPEWSSFSVFEFFFSDGIINESRFYISEIQDSNTGRDKFINTLNDEDVQVLRQIFSKEASLPSFPGIVIKGDKMFYFASQSSINSLKEKITNDEI